VWVRQGGALPDEYILLAKILGAAAWPSLSCANCCNASSQVTKNQSVDKATIIPSFHDRQLERAKIKSKLIELKREINSRLHRSPNDRQTTRRVIAYWRKLITVGARPAPRAYEQQRPIKRKIESKGKAAVRTNLLGSFLISICFGLLVICGMMIAILFLQIRDMNVEIALWKQKLALAQDQLSQLEKISQQNIIKKPTEAPAHVQITLSNDDMKVVRAFIKVPSQRGAQQKIYVGQEISDATAVRVPESLVSQMPKLRGARFLADENGAIILIGEGSNRADAVIEPQ
jgi:hypothetical protein